jgi:hypothetical protein
LESEVAPVNCRKCGGIKVYSGGCNGEWECWGDCNKEEDERQRRSYNNERVKKILFDISLLPEECRREIAEKLEEQCQQS